MSNIIFEDLDFSKYNEADVREEVIAPLLRFLGYRSGTVYNVIREQTLHYPYAQLGRRNSKNDQKIRGVADYILVAGNTRRWVIEAKSASVLIGADEIDQAYSYANHPEIGAIFFVLCNGHTFSVYQTNKGPQASPILQISYEDFNIKKHVLLGLLSPESILKSHPDIVVDFRIPIAPGLPSIVRISSGKINYVSESNVFRAINEMTITVAGGSVERSDGGLLAYIDVYASSPSIHNQMVKMGLTNFEAKCADEFLSIVPENPSIFEFRGSVIFPAGEAMFNMETYENVILEDDLRMDIHWTATGYLDGRRFIGTILNRINVGIFNGEYSMILPGRVELTLI